MNRVSRPRVSSISIICFLVLLPGEIFSLAVAAERDTTVFHSTPAFSAVLLKNQEYFPTLIKLIERAENEIIMSFFLFKAGVHKNSYPDRILAHLAGAVQKGVRVVVILENSGGHERNLDAENRQTKQLLEARGVRVFLDSPRKTMHNKLIVIDQRLILLGSHNLTQSALKYNNEMSVLIDRPELAREARAYMLSLIEEAR